MTPTNPPAQAVREALKPGAVEILCKEIGLPFDHSMETPEILVAFVAQLVAEIARERGMEAAIAHVTGRPPSEKSAEALRLAEDMVAASEPQELISRAERLHDFDHINNPEEGPCDHLIDTLSSCASAIRFGLEMPCASRHAAHAAQHVWRRLYGIKREDRITSHWSKHWSRIKLQDALASLGRALTPSPEQGLVEALRGLMHATDPCFSRDDGVFIAAREKAREVLRALASPVPDAVPDIASPAGEDEKAQEVLAAIRQSARRKDVGLAVKAALEDADALITSQSQEIERMREGLRYFGNLLTEHEDDGDTPPIGKRTTLTMYVEVAQLRRARELAGKE